MRKAHRSNGARTWNLGARLGIGVLPVFIVLLLNFVKQDPTQRYLNNLDISRFEINGTSYTDPNHSPFRILSIPRPLTPDEITYAYDFEHLANVRLRLTGVDRRRALKAIFERISAGCTNDHQRHLAILRFLHKVGHHNLIQPTHPDGKLEFDPLVLLELGEMRCGQVNRLAVDLFHANGYSARLVQAAAHVLAEIHYDGGWHYFDADIFGNGEVVHLATGKIPSMVELSNCPQSLDTLASYWEPDHSNNIDKAGNTPYPSWFYFAQEAYTASNVAPAYIEKTATTTEEDSTLHYGWHSYRIIPDHERQLSRGGSVRMTPVAPRIEYITLEVPRAKTRLRLGWKTQEPAAGYRVFVGSTSRGWNYNGASLPRSLMSFKSSRQGWKPQMYEARFRLPPCDLGLHTTTASCISLEFPAARAVFITVMAFDAYGESVGRRLFPMSEELRIER